MPEKFRVVISGMSGRFPECEDVCTFKEKLYNGDEFVTTDDRKWPVGYRYKLGEKIIPDPTGKLSNIYKIDYTVFKINTTFASSYDILNRLVLEPSFEAIVDAGINPYSLDGHNVGVFMSTGISDVESNIFSPNLESNILALIGCNKTMLSNRVSFALNLTGPSFTNHVDMHGGLESLTMAYKYVSEGLVESAVVGVAASIVDPRLSLQYFPLGILCPDGITRPFDEYANGYARSESAICFFLQRAEDAKRNYGEVKFSDFHYEGSKLPNFIGLNEEYLKTVLNHLYEANKFSPNSPNLGYMEMNAYGHKIMDKVESNAVAGLLTKSRKDPLLVGSLKSNIGHTEAAAGMMSVLKGLLMLESSIIPPNKHLMKLNNDIRAFKQKRLQVVTEQIPLPGNTVAVNSIGLFGSVGLAVIQRHEKSALAESNDEKLRRILLICGRTEKDLVDKLTQIEKLPYNTSFIALANDALGQHMPLHIYRGFTILPPPLKPIHDVKERGEQNRPVWFIFSGMGSQWNGMGKSLLSLPLFAETVAKCDLVLRKKKIDIYNILTSDDPTLFDDIINAFVGIITVQIGLYEVIKDLGIKPDGIIGHSVGENGCAYADGCLSLEQAVLASWARGVASTEVETVKGMMAAVGRGYIDIKDTLPEDVQVACHNSADSCTLTGPAESVNACVKKIQEEGIFAKAVNVANIAYHSKYIAAAGPRLLHRLEQVIKEPKERSTKWISTSVPESAWDTSLAKYCSAEYLTNNLLSPVLFEEGCKRIPENAICIEFAPHGLLQAILKRSLPSTCTNIPLTTRMGRQDNFNFLLSAIGRLYITGLEPQVNNIFPGIDYPVPRGTPSVSPYCTWYHQDDPLPYHLKAHDESYISGERIPISIKQDSNYAYLKDHKVNGSTTIPPSFFMYLTWWIVSWQRNEKIGSSSIVFEDVMVYEEVVIDLQETKYVSVMIQYGSGEFEIILREDEDGEKFKVIVTGRISVTTETIKDHVDKISDQKSDLTTRSQFYDIYKRAGYSLGEQFALVNDLYSHGSECETGISWNENWVTFLDALMKVQMFADNHENIGMIFPTRLRRLQISVPKFSSLEKGTIVPCNVDVVTKQLSCPGILMHGLRYKSSRKMAKRLDGLRFVSYQNPRCQNELEFITICLQLAVENLTTFGRNVSKLVVIDVTNKYSQMLEQIICNHDSFKSTVAMHSPKNPLCEDNCILIITEDVENVEKLYPFTDKLLTLVVSRFPPKKGDRMTQLFVNVTKQSFGNQTFSLLKRKMNYKQKPFVFIDEPGVRTTNKINDVIDETTPYFVIYKNNEFFDISKALASKKEYSNARYLFIMDEITNNQHQLDELIKEQMELNLSVSILKKGEWGLYRYLPNDTYQKVAAEDNFVSKNLASSSSLSPFKMEYICFNDYNSSRVQTKISSEEIIDFAYVALKKTGEKVMGLASTTNSESGPKCDPYLIWNVPHNWNSKDAVTVPHIYAQAYKLLLHQNSSIASVMMNIGDEYLLAEAFITLSLFKNLEIFVIVNTEVEVNFIKSRFPKIGLDHIFRCRSCNYEIDLRRLKKEGVDLIVNCLPGIQHVEASLKCLGMHGTYIEVGINNCLETYNIGLYTFLNSVSFLTARKTVSDLLQSPMEMKKTMKKFIEACIQKGVIVPPKLDTLPKAPSSVRTVKCYPQEEVNKSTAPRTIKYDCKHSYIIVGTGMKDKAWFQLVEWLIAQGARKFMIVLEKCSLLSRTEHQINRLLVERNVKILLTSVSKLDTKQETHSLLQETEKLGPLEAAFFVSIKISGKKISTLRTTVSPDVCFVGLFSTGLEEFERRHSNGSPAIFIHSDKSHDNNILPVLPHLNELLAHDVNNNAEILYQTTDIIYNSVNNAKIMRPCLNDYLPQDIETLIKIGREKIEELTFIEIPTLSRRYSCCKGVYPIFALPALHSIILQPLFQRLLYPVFSATSVPIRSLKEAAHKLYQSLNEIQPSGPVTIISETWTLPLALELVSYAQLVNRKYKVFVLEGNPKNWSDQVKQLQSLDTEKSNSTYADEIFHFTSNGGKYRSNGSISFESKVKTLSKNASCDVITMENVIRASKIIKDKISEVVPVTFGSKLLKNTIWFERNRPDHREFNLSVTSKMVVLNELNYRSLLNSPKVSKMINENAEFSFWEYTNLHDIR